MIVRARCPYQGTVVVVTGAGSGIGRAIARGFLESGAGVCVVGRREQPLRETVEGFPEERVLVRTADVADRAAVEDVIAAVVERFGRRDVVVNNAGVFEGGQIEDDDDAAWERMRGINLDALLFVHLGLVYDIHQERADSLAATHGARSARDLDEVFDATGIDAVLIASSTDTHAQHLIRAAEAGIAALCEKPSTSTRPRARDTAVRAAGHGIPVMVGFNRRFDRDYAELERIVRDGKIGDLELIQLSTRGPALPPLCCIADSGGQMCDQAVHFVDLARWISGLDPVEVFATGSALVEPRLAEHDDVDTSVVTLRLPTGALVQIDSARRTGNGYEERIEVLGSTGMAEATAPATSPDTPPGASSRNHRSMGVGGRITP